MTACHSPYSYNIVTFLTLSLEMSLSSSLLLILNTNTQFYHYQIFNLVDILDLDALTQNHFKCRLHIFYTNSTSTGGSILVVANSDIEVVVVNSHIWSKSTVNCQGKKKETALDNES